MKHFSLLLGDSDFALSLEAACAELLPAFYPTARAAEAPPSENGVHHLRIVHTELGFEIETQATPTGSATRRRLAVPALAMLALEEEIEKLVIVGVDNLIALHGGAVSTPNGACLVLGDSESGKSSTTFQLAELGHPCLCEEITLCEPSSWRVVPYPQTLSLSEALIADFGASFPIRGRLHQIVSPIVRYEPLESASAPTSTGSVTRILLPRFQPGAATRFHSVAAEEALTEVLGYSFPPNVDTETQFDRMIDLLDRVETTRFVYSGAAAAREALTGLFPCSSPW